MKYLIVGLGNIGKEYADTRHNIGFMVLDELAKQKGVEFDSDRLANVADFKFKGRGIYMVKPTTYMNLSGKALNYWMKTLKVPVSNTLVIMDDLALPFGTLRMRPKGASAGHNGLKNIEEILGSNAYPRLRFGIGDDFSRGKQVDYVLSPFSEGEFAELGLHVEKACEMILSFASVGIQQTMNQFNS
ncbi:aminoacyl-tRNA hydrolase [Flammeovirgaceae bacterium SG7u.111]|nr:aminoacyl-tRNA hydrolase [Flammeovirgaceae bacterium SG7u.132]WPO35944.1 aminoacyl-tRNA hydrolase [Flammeovirgaceae bacterium SG7u.111]